MKNLLKILYLSFKAFKYFTPKVSSVKHYANKGDIRYQDLKSKYDSKKLDYAKENLTHKDLKLLKLIEQRKNGKVSPYLKQVIKNDKFFSKILKQNASIETIGRISIKQDGTNTIQDIVIGYDKKSNRMMASFNRTPNNLPLFKPMKSAPLMAKINASIKNSHNVDGVTFASEMNPLNSTNVPKDVHQSIASNFDKISNTLFQSNANFNKNIQSLPEDFTENPQRYENQIFKFNADSMHLNSNVNASNLYMKYVGDNVTDYKFKPLFGKGLANDGVLLDKTQFNEMFNQRDIKTLSRLSDRFLLGQDHIKKEVYFKDSSLKNANWIPSKTFLNQQKSSASAEDLKMIKDKVESGNFILKSPRATLNAIQGNDIVTLAKNGKGECVYSDVQSPRFEHFKPLTYQKAVEIHKAYQKDPNIFKAVDIMRQAFKNIDKSLAQDKTNDINKTNIKI